MGSRLYPVALALGALAADALGLHGAASLLVLVAVVAAAAAALGAIGGVLAGGGSILQAVVNGLALVLLVAGSLVRSSAPVGGRVPTLAVSSLVLAVVAYAVPVVVWALAPAAPRPRPRLRTHP